MTDQVIIITQAGNLIALIFLIVIIFKFRYQIKAQTRQLNA